MVSESSGLRLDSLVFLELSDSEERWNMSLSLELQS